MGRTTYKFRDDDTDRRKSSKGAKHSKNIPGQGMRVINNWLDEEDDLDDTSNRIDDESFLEDDEYYDNISQTQRK
jgi:hypothetical protein